MIAKLESFLFGKVAGRVVARFAVTAAAWIVAQAAAKGLHVDASEVSALIMAGANGAYTYISDWRAKRAAAAAPVAEAPKA